MEVNVRNIPPEVTKERLRLYFGNPKRGGTLEIKEFDTESGHAVIAFKDIQDAEKVIETKDFEFKKDKWLVVSWVVKGESLSSTHGDTESTGDANSVLVRGLPASATDELVYQILEALTEITPSYVTALTVHEHQGSALVTLMEKSVADMLLCLDPEEIDGSIITFCPPSSEVDHSKEPVSPKKPDPPTEKTTDSIEENNNTKISSRKAKTSDSPREHASLPEKADCKAERIQNHSITQDDESKVLEQSGSFPKGHSIQPVVKAPKPVPRASLAKCPKESPSPGNNSTAGRSPSATEVSDNSQQQSRGSTPEKVGPLVRPKPSKAVLSRYRSEDKSDGLTQPNEPVMRPKGKLVMPDGLQIQNIVANLGLNRINKRVTVSESENTDHPSLEDTDCGRQAMLPTNVFTELRGKLNRKTIGSLDDDDN